MKKRFYLCSFLLILLVVYAYHVRSAYITQFTWKQTSENGLIGGGIINFGKNTSFTYKWPIIRKNEECHGIVLLCVDKWMIVYSLQDKHLGYYMYIWQKRKRTRTNKNIALRAGLIWLIWFFWLSWINHFNQDNHCFIKYLCLSE